MLLMNEYSKNTTNIFILKTIYFILQNMFRSLHTSSSVVHIKSTVNIQIIRVCYNVTVSLKCNLKLLFDNFHRIKYKHNE